MGDGAAGAMAKAQSRQVAHRNGQDSDTAIAVECKSHLSVDDVNEHRERMGLFKTCWPEYANIQLSHLPYAHWYWIRAPARWKDD